MLYARKRRQLPVILSADEVVQFLAAVPNLKHRTALMTAYAAGLRVSEVVRLKIADIDSGRMLIRVEQGKGGRDRYVMLSPQLLGMLRVYWYKARPAHWLFPGHNERTCSGGRASMLVYISIGIALCSITVSLVFGLTWAYLYDEIKHSSLLQDKFQMAVRRFIGTIGLFAIPVAVYLLDGANQSANNAEPYAFV
jgi:Phage integrase family